MSWAYEPLSSHYDVHNGLSKASKYFGSGFPFLAFKDVFHNAFLPEELDGKVETTERERESYSIKMGDVFVTRTSETYDELGMSSVALKDYPNATYNGFTKRLRPKTDSLLPRFIGYYMRSPEFRANFLQFSQMTTRASLKNENLLAIRIPVPPKETQKRIADILSAYDSLIENNRKQVRLLEESAQRLYKEWFIDLRFPGHESVSIDHETGLPEGWSLGSLDDLVFEGGTRKTREQRTDYKYYLPIDKIPAKSMITWESAPIEEAESSLVAFNKGQFVFGAMRPYFHKVIIAPFDGLTRTTCFVLQEKDESYRHYAYSLLFDTKTIRYATAISVGTTMPYVRWADFKRMPIVIPAQHVANQFSRIIHPFLAEICLKNLQIIRARESRDRLLPKLMESQIA